MTGDDAPSPGSAAVDGGADGGRPRGLAELLARRLRGEGRDVEEPLSVAEIRRSLLPYPLCREALELASKAEYDVALLRLLADQELLRSDDPELDEAVEKELRSPEPGLGVLDGHAASELRPGPRLGAAVATGREVSGDEPAAGAVDTDGAGRGGPEAGSAACDSCGRDLPGADGVRYCPTCGTAVEEPRCGRCGEELDADWRYCPFCGSERHG